MILRLITVLVVFNLLNNNFNLIYDQVFVDASTEFRSSFQQSENSIRFADIDGDSKDELIVFTYPYSYIFKHQLAGSNKIISFKENINSNSIFVGDLNNNSVPEIAFPTSQGIKFYEFMVSNKANTPYNVKGFSIDSTQYQFPGKEMLTSIISIEAYLLDDLVII